MRVTVDTSVDQQCWRAPTVAEGGARMRCRLHIPWFACLLLATSITIPAVADPPSLDRVSAAPAATGLSLADLEQMALQRNPTLAQAAAAVGASRGKALQAGLYPNPTIGYAGEQIGIAGTAGELQGGFVQQTI